MRCGCPICGTYMVHAEEEPGCVCPDCLHRCEACLGTNTVMSREQLRAARGMWMDPEEAFRAPSSDREEAVEQPGMKPEPPDTD